MINKVQLSHSDFRCPPGSGVHCPVLSAHKHREAHSEVLTGAMGILTGDCRASFYVQHSVLRYS